MEICKGLPHHPEQGFAKPCPDRWKCWRHIKFVAKSRPAGATILQGPYDFEDETCGKFMEP